MGVECERILPTRLTVKEGRRQWLQEVWGQRKDSSGPVPLGGDGRTYGKAMGHYHQEVGSIPVTKESRKVIDQVSGQGCGSVEQGLHLNAAGECLWLARKCKIDATKKKINFFFQEKLRLLHFLIDFSIGKIHL